MTDPRPVISPIPGSPVNQRHRPQPLRLIDITSPRLNRNPTTLRHQQNRRRYSPLSTICHPRFVIRLLMPPSVTFPFPSTTSNIPSIAPSSSMTPPSNVDSGSDWIVVSPRQATNSAGNATIPFQHAPTSKTCSFRTRSIVSGSLTYGQKGRSGVPHTSRATCERDERSESKG